MARNSPPGLGEKLTSPKIITPSRNSSEALVSHFACLHFSFFVHFEDIYVDNNHIDAIYLAILPF